jgi:hypothetical protein
MRIIFLGIALFLGVPVAEVNADKSWTTKVFGTNPLLSKRMVQKQVSEFLTIQGPSCDTLVCPQVFAVMETSWPTPDIVYSTGRQFPCIHQRKWVDPPVPAIG